MSKAIILGSAPSGKHYKKEAGDFVLASNDGFFRYPAGVVDAVCATDTHARLLKERPKIFSTPRHIPVYYAGKDVEKMQKALPQTIGVQSSRVYKNQWSIAPPLSTGTITPHFAAMVALSLGYLHLEVHGVDMTYEGMGVGARNQAAEMFAGIADVVEAMGGTLEFSYHSPLYPVFMAKRKPKAPPEILEGGTETISVPAGVGDALWVGLTLDPSKRYHVRIPDGSPRRAKEFWQLFPFVESAEYDPAVKYPQTVTHQLNHWLESGKRLEAFNGRANHEVLQHLKITDSHKEAEGLIVQDADVLRLGFYESSVSHAWRGQAWQAFQYSRVFQQIERNAKAKGKRLHIYVFGAQYDNFADAVIKAGGFEFTDLRGLDWGASIHCIKLMQGFIGFASGVPILAEALDVPTIMLMPNHLDKMQNTFCKAHKVGTPLFKAGRWGNYSQWVDWVMQTNWPLV